VKKNLVLLGMMGVGKTTIAKMVAKKQNLNFIDTDQNVQNENLMSIYEIFEKKGESFFRKEEEKEVLKSLKKTNCIIALGGGAFINKTVRENILNNAISIWLDLDVETLNSRIKQNYKRPLLKKDNNQEKLRELYDERKKIYQLANHKIDCAELNKDDICKKVIEIYEQH
tara:strand:+ start:2068 stop:2577 length:510 start_codon:yes stop_codon:yes gene_type:complete